MRLGWRRKRAADEFWLDDEEEEAETGVEVAEEEEYDVREGQEVPREEKEWKGVGSK